MYWWFIIPAIILALMSDRIDVAVKGEKKVKKVLLACSVGAVVVLLIPLIMRLFL
ncbi:hypothetical protein [Intestinibacter sp.]